jgi:hypothetical protein
VNSLLVVEYNDVTNATFILPKPLHACIIRFEAETSMTRRGEEIHKDNFKLVPITKEYTRLEREGGREAYHHSTSSGIETTADFLPKL